ncbi:MAG: hypothetical protein ACT4QF_22465 [Sporichthyaceae bacterium]
MAAREVEFAVHGEPVAENLGFAVRGRVVRDPMRVGDLLLTVAGDAAPAGVRLRVTEIRLWHQLIEELEAPCSAELLLVGDGIDRVLDGSTLASRALADPASA